MHKEPFASYLSLRSFLLARMPISSLLISASVLLFILALPSKVMAKPVSDLADRQPEAEDVFSVGEFRYEGNTIFDRRTLDKITAPYRGRKINSSELEKARDSVSKFYQDQGYVNSGAILPPQELNGTVLIRIIEGRLETVEVEGEDDRSNRLTNYVKQRIAAAGSILSYTKLLESMRLLQIDPRIKRISAELRPGSRSDLAILNIKFESEPTWNAAIELGNNESPLFGTFGQQVDLTNSSVFGLGDELNANYMRTAGSHSARLGYTIPISPREVISFRYLSTKKRAIEKPFTPFDIRLNSNSWDLSYRHQILRQLTGKELKEFSLGLTLSRIVGESSILGVPQPLSPGDDEKGRTELNAVRFSQVFLSRSSSSGLNLRSEVTLGSGSRGVGRSLGTDGRYVLWRGGAEYFQRIGNRPYLFFRADLQLADQRLPSVEQFTSDVRAYRRGFRSAENGGLLSIEFNVPVSGKGSNGLKVYPFADLGHVWSNGRSGGGCCQEGKTLASIGLGSQLDLGFGLSARIEYALPLVSARGISGSLQEKGVTGSVRYGVKF